MEALEVILKQQTEATQEFILELISYIDLTTLSDTDTNESVVKLVEKANVGFEGIHPAAICAYSQFADIVRKNLKPKMKTVVVGVGFPSGLTVTEEKVQHAEKILSSGAEELDIVLNHKDFFSQNYANIHTEISLIKSTLGNKHLKVILETGELKTLENIRKASTIACNAGADFIKTSTGKTTTGATPEAVYQMCLVIAEHYKKTGHAVGIKPSGGIRTFEEAALLHLIINKTLGKVWLTPTLFRLGASSLYDKLIQKYKEL